jgi:hypothetical protein
MLSQKDVETETHPRPRTCPTLTVATLVRTKLVQRTLEAQRR